MRLPWFLRPPGADLKAVQATLAQTEATIADLEQERAARLLQPDYTAAVETIDRELEAQRRAAAVHRDRVEAMIRKAHTDARAELALEKTSALARIEKDVGRRNAAAQRLVAALEAVTVAHADLTEADEAIFSGWPAVLPAVGELDYLKASSLPALCKRARHVSDFNDRMITGPVRALADGAASDLLEEVQQRGRRLLDALESEPIAEPVDDDEEEDQAA